MNKYLITWVILMVYQSLFDEQPSDEVVIGNDSRSDYEFIARTKKSKYAPIREMLDDWYSRYITEDRKDLKGRFQSPVESSHLGAFFELLLHEIHLRLGATITTHQETKTNKSTVPDFCVVDSSSMKSYVEASVVTGKSNKRQAAKARLNDLLADLNRMIDSTDYWLSMDRKGFPNAPSSGKQIARELNENIAKLNYADILTANNDSNLEGIPEWSFSIDGCLLTFKPIPKGENAKGKASIDPIALQMGEFERVDNRSPIRKTITRKANRYGRLSNPFIIALNCLEMVDEIDVMEALFGQEQFHIPFGQNREITSENISFSRKPNGALTNPFGPRYTRISGVMIAKNLRPWSLREASICLYHNPWADLQYSSVLNILDQSVLNGSRMEKIEGESLSRILNIDSYK